MKLPTTRYEKIKNKIAKSQTELYCLSSEKISKEIELHKYCKRHRFNFDKLESRDTGKLMKIYKYFDKRYPIDFQGGLRCDERGMKLHFWLDDDPDYLILHLSSTSENICFSGSTSWLVKACTLDDKINTLKTIRDDVLAIIK